MLLALWWYFWTLQQQITSGPALVRVSAHHFVVALAVAHAFAPAHQTPGPFEQPASAGRSVRSSARTDDHLLQADTLGEQAE